MEQVLHKRFSTWPISTGRDAQLLYQRIASYSHRVNRQTTRVGEAAEKQEPSEAYHTVNFGHFPWKALCLIY